MYAAIRQTSDRRDGEGGLTAHSSIRPHHIPYTKLCGASSSRMLGDGVKSNSPFETPKQTPSGHAVHRRRYSTHGTPVKASSNATSSYVVKIVSMLLLLWTIAYAVVCFRFISREEIDIAPEVPIFNNYNPFSSFGQAAGVTNGPQSNRVTKSNNGDSSGTDRYKIRSEKIEGESSSGRMEALVEKKTVPNRSVGSGLVNPFVSDACKATFSTLKGTADSKNSVSVIIPCRNEVNLIPYSLLILFSVMTHLFVLDAFDTLRWTFL